MGGGYYTAEMIALTHLLSEPLNKLISSFCFFYQSHTSMNSCQVVIEHPTKPNHHVIVGFLFFSVMPNSEIIRQIEQITCVFARQYCSCIFANEL